MQLAATLETRAREIESLSRDMLRYRRHLHHSTHSSSQLHSWFFSMKQRRQDAGFGAGKELNEGNQTAAPSRVYLAQVIIDRWSYRRSVGTISRCGGSFTILLNTIHTAAERRETSPGEDFGGFLEFSSRCE